MYTIIHMTLFSVQRNIIHHINFELVIIFIQNYSIVYYQRFHIMITSVRYFYLDTIYVNIVILYTNPKFVIDIMIVILW